MNRATIAGLTVLLPLAACKAELSRPVYHVELTHDGVCGLKVAGQKLPPIKGASFDAELQKMLPNKDSDISLVGTVDPRACIQKIAQTLGRLGYHGRVRAGFISEPPPGMVISERDPRAVK